MTWFASSANATEAAKAHYVPFLAVDFDFSSGHARAWSGTGNLIINGNTYLGTGELGSVSVTPERSNLVVERKTYQLSGTDPSLVSEADIDASFGRSVIEYLGFLNPDTGQLIDTPEINFEGEISNIRRVDGSNPVIEVNAENRLAILDQPDGWRYTHEHQLEFYPGPPTDLGFDQMARNELKEFLWGGRRVLPGSGRGPGGLRNPNEKEK